MQNFNNMLKCILFMIPLIFMECHIILIVILILVSTQNNKKKKMSRLFKRYSNNVSNTVTNDEKNLIK